MINLFQAKEKMVNFWIKDQPKILFLMIVATVMVFLRQLPYFIIILTISTVGIFLWIVSLLLFKLRSKSSVVAVILALLATGLAMAIEKTEIAQEAANFAYYVAIIAFIQVLLEVRNEKRKTS